jgi:hypothetical protein
MKRLLANQDGIALVTSLMLTLISLTIIMSLMYLMTQNIQQSGMNKRYRTALEASYGGTEIVMKEILPQILRTYDSATLVTDLQSSFSTVTLQVPTTQACLQSKLTQSTADWPASCSQHPNPKNAPDMSLQLQASSGQPYTVYSKILDTVKGNSDTSGLQLEGAGVSESLSMITPQHFPYLYRVEIQGERSANATEQANVSVLYAY